MFKVLLGFVMLATFIEKVSIRSTKLENWKSEALYQIFNTRWVFVFLL